ncbi:Gfo/Idh/MocA family protein [Nakamurella endophytica]|uniref:Dehydrogenase n=1 Tax=Nakamurella endophytica TaxID=1748367 RepID=A0A917SVZ8_9ACTN|nr:Gfo/Idh/MocA family oxidoreductase [Nakamurella endophytica]GGL98198.1 dehydrogenase [Nakamurella endophytica]
MVTRTPLRVGILGAGYIAAAHADAWAVHPGAELVAVADPDPARAASLAGRYGAAAVAGLAELLDRDVDAVSVCTPSPTHADLAVAALAAGTHVLCEKPVARTLADADRIVEAGQRGPGVLMVGHVSRYEPDHRAARRVVAEGTLGPVRMMSQSLVGPFPDWSAGGWLGDETRSGGPLVDLAIHSFDFLTWVVGDVPERVHAVGSRRPDGLLDYAVATVVYRGGAMAVVETSWGHPAVAGLTLSCEIVGTEGRLAWDYPGISVGRLHTASGHTRDFSPLGRRGFHDEIAAFVDAVRAGGPAPIPAEDGRTALRISLGAVESVRTGTAVDLTGDPAVLDGAR